MTVAAIRPGLFTSEPPYRLLASRCPACGQHHFPAQPTCLYCGATGCASVALSSTGTLYLCTVVRNAPPGFRGTAPYGFGVVELPEGLRVISPLAAVDVATLRPGMPVRLRVAPLYTDDAGRDVLSYAFEPAAG